MAPSTVGHISDPDFPSLNLPELEENEWQRLARAGMPLILPWHHEAVRLGTGYHSNLQLTPEPWATETPFDLGDLLLQAKIFRSEQGSTSSFVSRETSRKEESNDHTELGFGVGIKPAIPVIEVSVKGSYDKQLAENKDNNKKSVRSSCRYGCIDLEIGPRLIAEAVGFLRHEGLEAFKVRYGDYYLAGLRLGADIGMLLSSSSYTRTQKDNVTVQVQAKVIGIKKTKSWEDNFSKFDENCNIKLLGYDTLCVQASHKSRQAGSILTIWHIGSDAHAKSLEELQKAVEEMSTNSENLIERVADVLKKHGVSNGSFVTFEECEELCREGVVVELLLMPMARLRDVIKWQYYDNIV
ncbi:hypothetical protein P171DRAFT_365181 [Karstenula rhodostoma CBS 690.94]|uniref:Uncharacterized protein n=1 Tax=Karstenula rhodostoma CBS 690.94 TaxID=1392251 RepID=A0A9P4UAR7_9PLEO|nr:hypothetical protein P171DRAFT_365181 [Karstenula rhodostoma CBS 690.94]